MKKLCACFFTLLLWATSSCLITSCGGSDDDDNNGGGSVTFDVNKLIGQEYMMQEDEIVSIRNCTVGFLSPFFCYVHKWGRELDGSAIETGGWTRWDHGEKECLYKVNGNKIIIPYEHDGVRSEIVMNIVNGRPEGWDSEGAVDRKWTVSKERFDAKSGSADMFGYYSQDNVRKFAEQSCNDMVASGNFTKKYWESAFDNLSYSGGSIRIVDGSTIDFVDEVVNINQPRNEPVYIYQTQQYGNYTVYYYFCTDYYVSRHLYVMNGNTLVLSNGDQLVYSNGTLKRQTSAITFTKFNN